MRVCVRALTVQSAEQVRKRRGWKGFHRTAYTAMWCPLPMPPTSSLLLEEEEEETPYVSRYCFVVMLLLLIYAWMVVEEEARGGCV